MRANILRIAATFVLTTLGFRVVSAGAQPAPATSQPQVHIDHAGLKKLNWQLLIEPAAAGDPTIFQAIDHLHGLVVHHLDLVEGQPIAPDHSDTVLSSKLSPEQAATLLAKVQSVKMDFVTLRVNDVTSSQADWRTEFNLAKELKVKRIVCTPPTTMLAPLDQLTEEYHIGISIANSSSGPYRTPADLLTALGGRSPRITVCADIAEFAPAGVVPLDAVKQLAGHLTDVRLTDLHASDAPVTLGDGKANITDVLAELKIQKFKGAITIVARDHAAGVGTLIESLDALSAMVQKLAG